MYYGVKEFETFTELRHFANQYRVMPVGRWLEEQPSGMAYTDVLGNKVEGSFAAKASYFPFDYQYVRSDLKGSGTYRNNTASAVFKFNEANSQMGWVYNANLWGFFKQ